MFHNNIMKISEKLNKQNLLKIWLQVTYPTNFCMQFSFTFTVGKSENILFFLTTKWLE